MTESEIKKEFENIENLAEAKKIYKKLAKKLHPDIGGTNEEFKILGIVYNFIIENKIFFTNESKINIDIEKIITKILHFEDIIIEVVGSWIWLSGDTIEIKESLKEIGFKWSSKRKQWYFTNNTNKRFSKSNKSMEQLKNKYGCKTINTKQNKKIAM